jgi:hypothetical protein
MGGGGNVTINRVEGGHVREEDTTITIRMPQKLWIDECFVEEILSVNP